MVDLALSSRNRHSQESQLCLLTYELRLIERGRHCNGHCHYRSVKLHRQDRPLLRTNVYVRGKNNESDPWTERIHKIDRW